MGTLRTASKYKVMKKGNLLSVAKFVLQTLNEVYFIHDSISKGLDEIKEFTALEETTGRPYNQVLLNMYSGGDPLGFGIGKNL